MIGFSDMPKLSFLKIDKYQYVNTDVCDFQNIPRPFYSIGFIEEGSGEYIFDTTKVCVEKGDIIFVPMNSTYISKWNNADNSICISAHFQFDFPSPFPKHYIFPIQKISLDNYEELQNTFEAMYTERNNIKATQFSVLGLFYTVMGNIYPKLKFIRTPRLDERMKQAVEYIENNYTREFSVPELAKLCNMSVSHFHFCFKNQLGSSVVDYKNSVRIRHACLMLIESEKSIEEISEAVGFNSSIYFRETFKRIIGSTPSEYKKFEY